MWIDRAIVLISLQVPYVGHPGYVCYATPSIMYHALSKIVDIVVAI